jgi:hypothetical protein
MPMSVIQVRLPQEIIKDIDGFVKSGKYTTRSDVVRDAVRRMFLYQFVGIAPNTGDSVKEVRKIRKKLSREPLDIDEINRLGW